MEIFDLLTYDYNRITNHVVPSTTYTEVARLTTPPRNAGIYKVTTAGICNYSSISSSSYCRTSLDGGLTWLEIENEPKDKTTDTIRGTTSTLVHPGGVIDMIVQAKKEQAAPTFTIIKLDMMIERKG